MDSLFLLLSLSFPLLGGQDLLALLPSDVYWKAQGLKVTGESMLQQLQVDQTETDVPRLIRELGSEDFATRETATQALIAAGSKVSAAVEEAAKSADAETAARAKRVLQQLTLGSRDSKNRRLMAIRALGEMKHPPALPVLRKLAAAPDAGEANYARRAIAQIEGPAASDPMLSLPSAAELAADVAMIPPDCSFVAQIALRERMVIPLSAGLDHQPLFGRGVPRANRETKFYKLLGNLLEVVGNVRVESATFGMAFRANAEPTAVTAVVRGEYDPAALKKLLEQSGFKLQTQRGIEVAQLDKKCAVLLLSNRRLVVVAEEHDRPLPVPELLDGAKGVNLLKNNIFLWAVLEQVDRSKPVWAAMTGGEFLTNEAIFNPIEQATITLEPAEKDWVMTFQARGSDKPGLDKTFQELNTGLEKAQMEAGQLVTIVPALKPIEEILDSLKTERTADGFKATGQTADPASLLMLPLVINSSDWTE